jgi:hypothetical protein
LATGTIRNGDLETRLAVSGSPAKTIHISVGNASGCEEAVSSDGKWLATVVPSDKLTILIPDIKAGALHRHFSSEWHTFDGYPLERGYDSSFLGGFLTDNSLILWRYIPQKQADPSNASVVKLHVQRWSIDGELLSEDYLGFPSYGSPHFITAQNLQRLWIPGCCESICYRCFSFDHGQWKADNSLTLPRNDASRPVDVPSDKHLLTVLGEQTKQKAVLLDYSGKVDSEVSLPFFPNLLVPLVPDWFYVRGVVPSPDGQMAAIGRTRVAWVLIDTDRDWGSEVLLLKLHPLSMVAPLRTGKGGIRALALDHRSGAAHLVAVWGDRWHDLRWEETGKGKLQETATW